MGPTAGLGSGPGARRAREVFFAEHGSRHDLLATIAATRTWVDQRYEESAGIPHGYLAAEGGFPERLPWLILCSRFLDEFALAVDRWSEWAAQVVETWPEDVT